MFIHFFFTLHYEETRKLDNNLINDANFILFCRNYLLFHNIGTCLTDSCFVPPPPEDYIINYRPLIDFIINLLYGALYKQ